MTVKYVGCLTEEEFDKRISRFKRLPQETIERARRVIVNKESPRDVAKDTGISHTRMYELLSVVVNGRKTMRSRRWPVLENASSPCQECQHFNKCKHELKACEIFAEFVQTGIVYSPEKAKPKEYFFSKMFPTHPITIARKERKRVLRERKNAKTNGKRGRPRKNDKPEIKDAA